jgi:NADPH2:quinone reductase
MTYARTPERLRDLAGRLFELIADGKLDVRIGARYPLDQAAQAHRDLEGRKTTGKVLLIP